MSRKHTHTHTDMCTVCNGDTEKQQLNSTVNIKFNIRVHIDLLYKMSQ
jgi:hypothetical protein